MYEYLHESTCTKLTEPPEGWVGWLVIYIPSLALFLENVQTRTRAGGGGADYVIVRKFTLVVCTSEYARKMRSLL